MCNAFAKVSWPFFHSGKCCRDLFFTTVAPKHVNICRCSCPVLCRLTWKLIFIFSILWNDTLFTLGIFWTYILQFSSSFFSSICGFCHFFSGVDSHSVSCLSAARSQSHWPVCWCIMSVCLFVFLREDPGPTHNFMSSRNQISYDVSTVSQWCLRQECEVEHCPWSFYLSICMSVYLWLPFVLVLFPQFMVAFRFHSRSTHIRGSIPPLLQVHSAFREKNRSCSGSRTRAEDAWSSQPQPSRLFMRHYDTYKNHDCVVYVQTLTNRIQYLQQITEKVTQDGTKFLHRDQLSEQLAEQEHPIAGALGTWVKLV